MVVIVPPVAVRVMVMVVPVVPVGLAFAVMIMATSVVVAVRVVVGVGVFVIGDLRRRRGAATADRAHQSTSSSLIRSSWPPLTWSS